MSCSGHWLGMSQDNKGRWWRRRRRWTAWLRNSTPEMWQQRLLIMMMMMMKMMILMWMRVIEKKTIAGLLIRYNLWENIESWGERSGARNLYGSYDDHENSNQQMKEDSRPSTPHKMKWNSRQNITWHLKRNPQTGFRQEKTTTKSYVVSSQAVFYKLWVWIGMKCRVEPKRITSTMPERKRETFLSPERSVAINERA